MTLTILKAHLKDEVGFFLPISQSHYLQLYFSRTKWQKQITNLVICYNTNPCYTAKTLTTLNLFLYRQLPKPMKNPYSDDQYIERYAKKRRRSKTTSHRRSQEKSYVLSSLKALKIQPNSLILDVPSGTGWLAQELGHQVFSSDLSLPMLKVLQEDYPHLAPQAVCADITKLPFPDKSFDVSISIRMFHHFPTGEIRRQALSELSRVSRQGVILSFVHSISLHAFINRLKGIDHLRFSLPLSTLKEECQQVGLELKKTYCPWKYVRRNWLACFAQKQ